MTRDFAIAQLRHLYAQMVSGDVRDVREAARDLLGPAIEALESGSIDRKERNYDDYTGEYLGDGYEDES